MRTTGDLIKTERFVVYGGHLSLGIPWENIIELTLAVAVDAVLVVLVLEHLADEDLQAVLHLLLALLLHLGPAIGVRRRHRELL